MNQKKLNPSAYGFVFPAVVSICIFTLLPIAYTFYLSLTNYNMYHLESFDFVGLKNYVNVLTGSIGSVFFPVLLWTIVFAAISTAGGYFIGLLLAILLNNPDMHESKIYKALLIIPWALPATIALLAWQGLLNERFGGINNLLRSLNISEGIPWMTDVFWARFGLILVNVWLGFPYMMNVCLGGLQAISPTLYEAASIDGASTWKKFTAITFPYVTRLSAPLIVSTFAFNFNNFGNIYMITEGGPPRKGFQFAGSTDILSSTVYKMTMWSNRYELSATLSVFVFLLVGTLTLINMNMTGSFKEKD